MEIVIIKNECFPVSSDSHREKESRKGRSRLEELSVAGYWEYTHTQNWKGVGERLTLI